MTLVYLGIMTVSCSSTFCFAGNGLRLCGKCHLGCLRRYTLALWKECLRSMQIPPFVQLFPVAFELFAAAHERFPSLQTVSKMTFASPRDCYLASQSNTVAAFPQAFVQRDLELSSIACKGFCAGDSFGVSFAICLMQNIGTTGGSKRGWAQTSLQQFVE